MRGPLAPSERALLAACALVFLYLIILGIGAFWGSCHDPNSRYKSDSYSNYDNCTVNDARLFLSDVATSVDKWHDDVNAISTAVVAIFTVVLVLVTGRQARLTRITADAAAVSARAARDSADALPNLERAYIFIEIYPGVADGIARTLGELIDTTKDGGGKQTRSIDVRYQFINHGKTPAVIKVMSAVLKHWINLPSKIEYADKPLPREIVVRAGEIYPAPAERHTTNQMNERFGRPPGTTYIVPYQEVVEKSLNIDSANSIKSGGSFLWFFGHVVYDDVFGREHETRFCWRYHGPTDKFEQYNRGDDRLNHRS